MRREDDVDHDAALERTKEAFAEHVLTKQRIAYLRRGRRLAHVGTPALEDAWVELYTLLAEAFDARPLPPLQEIEAELSLRGLEPPRERAKAAEWVFGEKVKARLAEIEADPKLFAELVQRFEDDLATFRRERDEALSSAH